MAEDTLTAVAAGVDFFDSVLVVDIFVIFTGWFFFRYPVKQAELGSALIFDFGADIDTQVRISFSISV